MERSCNRRSGRQRVYRRTKTMMNTSDFKVVIENPKGSYKSFETENDPTWSSYPLKGVTYPVDYGCIEGYVGEDGADLDIFVGTGNSQGYIRVWRLDVPTETKFFMQISDSELEDIKNVFAPVLREVKMLTDADFTKEMEKFKAAPKDRLAELRRATLVASTGASTRLAGSKLSDKDVELISRSSEQK